MALGKSVNPLYPTSGTGKIEMRKVKTVLEQF